MSDTLTQGKAGAWTVARLEQRRLHPYPARRREPGAGRAGEALWASATNGQEVARAELQSDGNFVLYTPDKPVWHTDTQGKADARLVLQDDGNLVLYAADGPAWATNTQTDGPPPPAPARNRGPAAWLPSLKHPSANRSPRPRRNRLGRPRGASAGHLHRRVRRHHVGDRGAFLR